MKPRHIGQPAPQTGLRLRFDRPATIVSRERAKELFTKMRRDLGIPTAGKKEAQCR